MSCVCVTYNGYKSCMFPQLHQPRATSRPHVIHLPSNKSTGKFPCGDNSTSAKIGKYWKDITCVACLEAIMLNRDQNKFDAELAAARLKELKL